MASVILSARSRSANQLPTDLIPLRTVVEMLGVSESTARVWAATGVLPCYRVGAGGHRRWSRREVLEHVGATDESTDKVVVAWSRCSTQTRQQRENLARQKQRVFDYCKEHFPSDKIVELSNSASGFNLKNPKLLELIRMIVGGEVKVLVLEYLDRLNRSIAHLITYLCELNNCEVVVIEQDEEKSDETQLVEDIASLCTLFAARKMGARSKCEKKIPAEVVKRATDLVSLGRNWTEVARAIEADGFRNDDGSVFTVFQLRKVIAVATVKSECGADDGIGAFMATSKQKPETVRTQTKHAYDAYVKFAQEKGLAIACKAIFAKAVRNARAYAKIKGRTETVYKGIVWVGVPSFQVKEYAASTLTAESTTESFLRFYNENRGWRGNIAELIRVYREWAAKFNLVALPKIKIKSTLAQLGIIPNAKRVVTL
jgi:putative resolvase